MCVKTRVLRSICSVYLVRVRYVNRFSAFGHVPDNARAPWYVYLFFLLHLLQRGTRAHIEQFGHQTPGLASLIMVRSHRALRRHRTDIGGADLRSDDQSADDLFFERRHRGGGGGNGGSHGGDDDLRRLDYVAAIRNNGVQ